MQAGREIKFRGKSIETGEWVHGCYSYLKSPLSETLVHYIIKDGFTPVEVDPDTVGQFTGLCDTNSNEIYTGDVVHVEHDDGVWIDSIVFRNGCYELNEESDDLFYVLHDQSVSVVGNVYDNPDFLPAV
ncbi:YopX family protein [Brevibacillus porteri]|uniref:YopX family protein n=1 Tax=Brevibacillus porteri TaxID=2126350 RepID=UPI003D1C1521